LFGIVQGEIASIKILELLQFESSAVDDVSTAQLKKTEIGIGLLLEPVSGTVRDFLYPNGPDNPVSNHNSAPSTTNNRWMLCLHIIKALSILHEHGFVHGALYPENVLLSKKVLTDTDSLESTIVRLTGFTTRCPLESDGGVGISYAAPELRDISAVSASDPAPVPTKESDFFSLGILMWEVRVQLIVTIGIFILKQILYFVRYFA
jgi:serine/threonine protein kinase